MNNQLGNWQFYNPVQIFSGRDCRTIINQYLQNKNLLLVSSMRGRTRLSKDYYLKELLKNNKIYWLDTVTENPGLTYLQKSIDSLVNIRVDAIVAFGGGSVIDAAKVIRISLAEKCKKISLIKLLENPEIYAQAELTPLYAIPTTAGTGSEVTPFATVWHHEIHKKLSLSGRNIFPTVAIVDSALSDDLPIKETISTGLDAINQAAESIWNKNANSITLAYAFKALELGLQALPLLTKDSTNQNARDAMAEASLLAGLAISHTRTALCHSISYPLTAHFSVPHGLACAFTMPAVLNFNLLADDGRLEDLSKRLTGSRNTNLLLKIFEQLNTNLSVKNHVKEYIKNFDDLLLLKKEMINADRAENNLSKITDRAINKILHSAWQQK